MEIGSHSKSRHFPWSREDGHSQMTSEIPPLKPLAPIVDQMRIIADDELPSPQTCRVQLFDDGTFRVSIFHSMGHDETQAIIYDRATSEIYWEHSKGSRTHSTRLTGGETLIESSPEERDVRVIATVEPPYR